MATLDLVYEIERRGLFAFLVPSIFTPLHDTRMEKKKGVAETRELTPAAVAVDDEVLEDEPAPGPVQLVGAHRLAAGRSRACGCSSCAG